MANMKRYLTIRILYPKSGHGEDILAAVRQVSEAARRFKGLIEIGAWLDEKSDRIVSISLWDSREQAMEATWKMHSRFTDIAWSEWERKPAENLLELTRVA